MMRKHANLAYYKKEDWDRFIRSIDDRESMNETWEEWHQNFMNTKANLVIMGFEVHDMIVDVDKLYCWKRRIKNDGRARSQFVMGDHPFILRGKQLF